MARAHAKSRFAWLSEKNRKKRGRGNRLGKKHVFERVGCTAVVIWLYRLSFPLRTKPITMAHYFKQVQVFVLEALFVLCCFPAIVARGISKRQRREHEGNDQLDMKGRGPRKSDLPNTQRRRRLTLPSPVGSKALRTADKSQCNLLSKLPSEIRQLIWTECLGQMTFHLEIRDRKLKHVRCCSPTPASCDDNTGNGCHRYRKGSPQNTHLLSLPLTCRQMSVIGRRVRVDSVRC